MFRFTLLALLVLGLACIQSEAKRGGGKGGRGNSECKAIFKGMAGLRDARRACRGEEDRGLCIAQAMDPQWVDDNGDWTGQFQTDVTTMLDALLADGDITQAQYDAVTDAFADCITEEVSGSGLKDMEKCLVKACSDAAVSSEEED